MNCNVMLRLGEDRGQSFGSLFEVESTDGEFTVGAGFCDVYNTQHRSGRLVVQFFIRPDDSDTQASLEPMSRPWSATGTYMFNLGDAVVAMKNSRDAEARLWDEATGSWMSYDGTAPARMRTGNGIVAFGDSSFYHDGEVILGPPERGNRQRFYYAAGHLFFYHVDRGEASDYRPWVSDEDGFSKLYACPWRPAEGGAVDLSQAIVETLPIVGETTFAWGQLDGQVVTCSNIGGVYTFDGERWRTVREPVLGESFQVYTMVRYYDRLLLGQYPAGELFEFDGEDLIRIDGWPPRIEGVSGSGRECQTAAVWGGQLLVGVWPWAELWSHHPDRDDWESMGRLFSHPEPDAQLGHPYQAQCEEQGLVLNQYGQRITSMVPLGDSLMISTSAKWPFEPDPQPEFMSEEQLAEYGMVWRLRMPGCVSAPIHWTPDSTKLEFAITAGEMRITQNGLTLGSVALPAELSERLQAVTGWNEPTWGDGVFGPFGGRSVAGSTAR